MTNHLYVKTGKTKKKTLDDCDKKESQLKRKREKSKETIKMRRKKKTIKNK